MLISLLNRVKDSDSFVCWLLPAIDSTVAITARPASRGSYENLTLPSSTLNHKKLLIRFRFLTNNFWVITDHIEDSERERELLSMFRVWACEWIYLSGNCHCFITILICRSHKNWTGSEWQFYLFDCWFPAIDSTDCSNTASPAAVMIVPPVWRWSSQIDSHDLASSNCRFSI